MNPEQRRLGEERTQKSAWKKWGSYLSERHWGTVREDYSEGGDAWSYFPHDHARSRAYQWGEDGLAGPEGNHGEDVNESVRQGQWQLLECVPAWDGNASSDAFIACAWQGPDGERVIVCVNYAAHPSQCYVRLPFPDLGGRPWRLRDLLGDAGYERDGNELQSRRLYLDVPPWQCHAFEMKAA